MAEVASHLAFAQAGFVEMAAGAIFSHGDGTKPGLAHANAQARVADPERNPSIHAEILVEASKVFATSTAGLSGSQPVYSPMGDMDLDTLACYLLTHTAMHGCAIAKALKQPLPVGATEVLRMVPFVTKIMPNIVNQQTARSLKARYMLHLRGGPSLCAAFDHGVLTITDRPTGRVECHLVAEPVAFFLVAGGIVSQYGQIAQGKLLTYGLKPWLAFRFVNLLAVP